MIFYARQNKWARKIVKSIIRIFFSDNLKLVLPPNNFGGSQLWLGRNPLKFFLPPENFGGVNSPEEVVR